MVWEDKRIVYHGSRWRFVILALLVVAYIFLFWVLVKSFTIDPLLAITVLVIVVLLAPVAAFIIQSIYTEGI